MGAPMPKRAPSAICRLRGIALLPAGAFAVHQLRLLLQFGSGAAGEHAAHGHLYVGSVLTWVMLALAAGLGGLLVHAAGDWRCHLAGRVDAEPSTRSLWMAASVALVGLHALQELLEGLFHGGPGLAGLVGLGGLWALASCLGIGGLIALALRGARSLAARAARLRPAPAPDRNATAHMPRLRSASRPRVGPLARRAAERAPPVKARLAH